ncbi:MAG: hypothetical protein AABX38_04655 [Candidatus Micrarchaeota archaeon]
MKLSINRTALSLGIVFAALHFVMRILIAATNGAIVNYAMELHGIRTILVYPPLNIVELLILTIGTFIGGLVIGALFAIVWNAFEKIE